MTQQFQEQVLGYQLIISVHFQILDKIKCKENNKRKENKR
jgi:hypothetical protein